MIWSIIQNKKEYEQATIRLEALSQIPPSPQSDEGRELMLLGYLVAHYEEKEFPVHYPNAIEAIKVRMETLGLRVSDLLHVFGDRGTASKVLNHQRPLSLAMIRALTERLSLPAELLIQSTAPKRYSTKKMKKNLHVNEPKAYRRSKR